jgi:hypothetical protein
VEPFTTITSIRKLQDDGEVLSYAWLIATSEPRGTLRRNFEAAGEVEDVIIRGHPEVVLRNSIAPLTEFEAD